MTSVKVMNGNLYIIFDEDDYDTLVSYRLDNGAEIDFSIDDKLVQFVLPNFEVQFNHGPLENVPIEYIESKIDNNNVITLTLKIVNDIKNISFSASSIIHKTYI